MSDGPATLYAVVYASGLAGMKVFGVYESAEQAARCAHLTKGWIVRWEAVHYSQVPNPS